METSVNNECKAFTSLEQSKKLEEILPFESADSLHCIDFDGDLLFTVPKQYSGSFRHQPELIIPCWSLAALIDALPAECECMALEHINYGNNRKKYFMHYVGGENTEDHDNPVDACYAMIIRLHELKML